MRGTLGLTKRSFNRADWNDAMLNENSGELNYFAAFGRGVGLETTKTLP
jgi:hypothetical protein